ncbi:hypothetical protein [Tsukamurella paurometabola]|uniref:Uncharacterized protein n=1 Tax=Tsukamurella paurometabola TaxID=2061 RepID=A0A3P8KSW2_TSUPA|nr:hypothetical protein [Tsukamurella paurometabola]MBS4100363.1 hypothetical protein [Tsukamurella paurometabola]UEA82718.1 hypothetical protein LK411_20505 [Tsukamurella paurometabola]VDR39787.1 Uncharacterised protein [Tsukamurella paurometabola]
MDTSDLDRAAREYAAVLSEAAAADLSASAGDRTVADLTDALIARASALAAALGAVPPPPENAGPPDAYGGGHERPFRRALRRLAAAAAAAPGDDAAAAELGALARAIDEGALGVSAALGVG